MSQESVETILGRLLTDENFRGQFLANPQVLCGAHGLELTAAESAALLCIDVNRLRAAAARLDPRIVRAITINADHPRADATARLSARRGPRAHRNPSSPSQRR